MHHAMVVVSEQLLEPLLRLLGHEVLGPLAIVAEILQAAAHVDEDGRVLRAQRQQQRPLAALLQQHRLCERRVGVACV